MFDQHPDHARPSQSCLFENADWCVLVDGLEHRTSGYFIARETIAMRRGALWEWPLHLSEKSWCSPRSFREAFLVALDVFGVAPDADLTRSFTLGFGLVAGAGTKSQTDDFVAIGDIVRPKAPVAARKRVPASDARASARRSGMPVSQRLSDTVRQRATL